MLFWALLALYPVLRKTTRPFEATPIIRPTGLLGEKIADKI